jgi:hypothetical protein
MSGLFDPVPGGIERQIEEFRDTPHAIQQAGLVLRRCVFDANVLDPVRWGI